jgi:outer membrane protein assembly factor BamA
MGPNDVLYVFGLGPRLNLPIGPVRLDFTWGLRPSVNSDGTRSFPVHRLQFAIGPSF